MQYSSGSVGRIFVLRFDENDTIYAEIETLAAREHIASAVIWLIGGVKNGGVVVGPRNTDERPLNSMAEFFTDGREICGIGTVFRTGSDAPKLHLHAAIGKGTITLTGCPRKGLESWLVTEGILLEMHGVAAKRLLDEKSGMELLKILSPQT